MIFRYSIHRKIWELISHADGSIHKEDAAKILLENMISMLLKMGRKIVVEGIETKEQYDYLASQGITYAQGFYFSKPVPKDEFLKFIQEKNK